MAPEKPPTPKDLSTYLSLDPKDIAEKFSLIERREEARLENKSFIDHPVAHARNRWCKPRPFADNRIILQGPGYDYINASPIQLGGLRYIATQNPTSIPDFWRMIRQENVEAIVMLMPIEGNGEDRCARYFPISKGEVVKAGDMQISLASEVVEHSRTEVRELRVALGGGASRTVWHFAFLGWPDHGIPAGDDRAAFLDLVKLSRYGLQADVPRLVHCSAGVGRTGTFIALDYCLQQLEQGSLNGDLTLDPIFETVDRLREQRVMMVYKEVQYRFIYDTLRWRWNDKHGITDDLGTNLSYTSSLKASAKTKVSHNLQQSSRPVKEKVKKTGSELVECEVLQEII